MSLIAADRVFELANSPGTGTVTLLGAVPGYRTFSAGVGDGNTCHYCIADQAGSNWEVGIGTVSAGALARTSVLASSNVGALVNFSSGTQNVFCTIPAALADPAQENHLQAINNISTLRGIPATSRHIWLKGYAADDDGGGGEFRGVNGAAAGTYTDNGGTIIVPTGGDGSSAWLRVYGGDVKSEWFGIDKTGAADDTAKLVALFAAGIGKTVLISGRPRITATIALPGKMEIRFTGGSGAAGFPDSYITKGAAVSGPALITGADATIFHGGGVVGLPGNTGDGIQIRHNSCVWYHPVVSGCGNDGIRIGDDAGTSNSNSNLLVKPVSFGNGRHGMFIHMPYTAAGPNTNVNTIISPFLHNNSGDGLNIGTAWYNTVLAPTLEANAGWGLNIGGTSGQPSWTNKVIGGDSEANTAGSVNISTYSVYDKVELSMMLGATSNSSSSSSVVPYENTRNSAAIPYTPTISGGTSAGVGTYSAQKGVYAQNGKIVDFGIQVAWTAHTGTGQVYVDLPPVLPYDVAAFYRPVAITCNGLTLPAGSKIVAMIFTSGGGAARIQLYTENAGAITALSMPASGTLYINGSYVAA